MEIKKRPQRPSWVASAKQPNKCPTCNSWLKTQPDKTRICVGCHFRNVAKEEAQRAAENAAAPVKPTLLIGKL